MFYGTSRKTSLYCPMLDARRMEVYYAVYNSKGETIRDISAKIITEDTFSDLPSTEEILIFGDGAAKCKGIIKRPNIQYDDNFRISASHMYIPAIQALKYHHFEDVAYFEPFYLKDFITSTPRKNVLGN